MTTVARSFDAAFLFGAATAAFQIEGATHTDGRTDSIWDAFCRVPDAVINGDDGTQACDHYHRYADDVALMADLGLQSYRFSTSWARIRPDGGPVNPAGLDFYSRLVDELLGTTSCPGSPSTTGTCRRRWRSRAAGATGTPRTGSASTPSTVHEALGDRVPVWTTLNEPWCAAFVGHISGAHAPGLQDPAAGLAAAHHLLLGHGLAVEALRAADPALRLGLTLNLTVADPVDPDRPGDVDAARRIDGQMNRIFLDPIFRAAYPEDVLADVAGLGLEQVIRPGDLATIAAPIDVLGVNYYFGQRLSDRPRSRRWTPRRRPGVRSAPLFRRPTVWSAIRRDRTTTAMGWPDPARRPAAAAGPAARGVHRPGRGRPLRHRERGGLRRPGRR